MKSGDSLENYLFGPLDKSYCLLFYVFSVIMFILFVLAILGLVMNFVKGKRMSMVEFGLVAYSLLATFLSYLSYRLLYSMCISSNLSE